MGVGFMLGRKNPAVFIFLARFTAFIGVEK